MMEHAPNRTKLISFFVPNGEHQKISGKTPKLLRSAAPQRTLLKKQNS
jgi:hypothetical protein